jgi:hypothetical protein
LISPTVAEGDEVRFVGLDQPLAAGESPRMVISAAVGQADAGMTTAIVLRGLGGSLPCLLLLWLIPAMVPRRHLFIALSVALTMSVACSRAGFEATTTTVGLAIADNSHVAVIPDGTPHDAWVTGAPVTVGRFSIRGW